MSKENGKLKVIVSGGGTGGHIFPAVAIANAIKNKYPDADILFVGAKGKMEMEKVPKAGYPIKGLWISGLQRKLTLANLMFPLKVIVSLIHSMLIIKSFKPDIAIGVGGYAGGPLLKAATMMGVPALIHESNSFPGITNKLLGKSVNRVCVAFANMEKYFPKSKLVLTGNPVRQEIVKLAGKREDALKHFNLDDSRPVVLVIGGSLGARSINQAIHESLPKFKENNYQVLWQTGVHYKEQSVQAVTELVYDGVKPHEFIYEMDLAYAAADVVVSRAGAMSVSELSLVAKPAILVPYPYASEDHQTKNAMTLVLKDAAVLVKDDQTKEKLYAEIVGMLTDPDKMQKLVVNINKLAISDADQLILKEVESLLA
ncbi:MAG: UDP-N-acetylglucosamine--N-acetylmuramyl-(pentapeptide) pyrophosphoryl-undecaprenol N-acetylglucosamine transferase [Glaciecola sp.]|jgi:UDP-N-acetylglucosamine--N-acetylmuramyl-(pentapeptide) pyrophosphoryl-undecaprenol N-acetylglucosamine transferase